MTDIFEKGFYLGLGLLSLSKEKAEEIINDLVEKGKISSEQSSKAIKDLLAKAEEEKKVLTEKIDSALESAMKKMNLATRHDLEELNKKLDKIIKQQKQK